MQTLVQARFAAALPAASVTVTGDLLALFLLQITGKVSASSAWIRFHLDLSPEDRMTLVYLGLRCMFYFLYF